MKQGHPLIELTTRHPRLIAAGIAAVCAALLILAALPSLAPQTFPFLAAVEIDTDPENMLSRDEAVRVFHNEMKRVLDLNDIVVVGVINEADPDGVFNVDSLGRIYALTQYAKGLRGQAIGEADPQAGVVEIDIIAPSTVDNIEQGGLGVVRFEWLMPRPPATAAEAVAVREKAARLPFLNGTLISEDRKAIALYIPLTSKDLSHRVASRLEEKIATFDGEDRFHITGLPVAEDTFGVEMFKQMAISAPLAMLVIFLLLFVFFRKVVLILAPMIIAVCSVIVTMGLLIVTGNTIHIMSSMIPIFIMPIAVLDSVHILSEFFDRYQQYKDRRETILRVMDHLFTPMLFTSLTSTAGFASLALTPIPPVQVFGAFVATGVMAAWLLTILFVPAYVMFIPERSFEGFGLRHDEGEAHPSVLGRVLHGVGGLTWRHAELVIAAAVLLVAIAAYGISRIQINDNPTKWFKPSHPIRVADRVLNDHFGGTYMAYLAFLPPAAEPAVAEYAAGLEERLRTRAEELAEGTPEIRLVLPELLAEAAARSREAAAREALLEALATFAETQAAEAEGDVAYAWEEALFLLDEERQLSELFKQPETLRYLADVQDRLLTTGAVGKSNSLSDIVKTVHRELFEGDAEAFRIPDSSRAVAQCLITYESSHRPHDLYHFVTPDYRRSAVWVQLKSGDNRAMSAVAASLRNYVEANPPPFGLTPSWFGLTYINVVWQEKMVAGMLQAFLGSFLVVLLMMVGLFRSGWWGLLSMVPLTVTIGLIYGVIGLVGKDYDMPVAVLSSLTLGLAIDFAIHFLARSRALYAEHGSWEKAQAVAFGEPARAIARNVLVIAIGFLPLLAAPLVPYNTVGIFMAAILFVSGAGTLFILPALMRLAQPAFFPETARAAMAARIGTCAVAAAGLAGLVALNLNQFAAPGWPAVAGSATATALVAWAVCWWLTARSRGGRVTIDTDQPKA